MTIDEIELYDVEAVDEILSHLSDEDANVVQISHVVPTNPQIAEELLRMNIAKAYEEMARLIKTGRR